MLEKLASIEERYDELERLMSDPEVMMDYSKVTEYSKERASLEEKAFRNSLADMSDQDKQAALEQRRAGLAASLGGERDPSKRLDIAGSILDLDSELGGLQRGKGGGQETNRSTAIKLYLHPLVVLSSFSY